MHTYSILQPSGLYKYYEAMSGVDEWGKTLLHDPIGSRPPGVHFEQALPRLPLGAVEVGEGEEARGTIAREGGFSMGPVAIVLALGILFYLSSR